MAELKAGGLLDAEVAGMAFRWCCPLPQEHPRSGNTPPARLLLQAFLHQLLTLAHLLEAMFTHGMTCAHFFREDVKEYIRILLSWGTAMVLLVHGARHTNVSIPATGICASQAHC